MLIFLMHFFLLPTYNTANKINETSHTPNSKQYVSVVYTIPFGPGILNINEIETKYDKHILYSSATIFILAALSFISLAYFPLSVI